MSDNGDKIIEIPTNISVRDLAERIQASPIDIIKSLMSNGVMASINQQIDYDTAAIVIGEFGFEARPLAAPEPEPEEQPAGPSWKQWISDEDPADLVDRPPVVTILGHVDHGKTTLLDAIRETNVAGGEAGGITQHIAAYQVRHNERGITFLDTPGHAAFTAMRARGAQGADIAVLVVAADDGVMPQTREALAHARAARVPILVALNKIDRPNANPDRVKQQLANEGLKPDDWGGDTLVVPVSAKQRKGIQDLLEAVLLTADSAGIKANPSGQVFGTVVEAAVDRTKGVTATLLVQNGTLKVGDAVLAGTAHGGIRAMFDFQGNPIEQAGPSTPVSVLGLSDLPHAGEVFRVVETAREARSEAHALKQSQQVETARPRGARSLEQVFEAFQAGETQEMRLVVKADVQGSLEPIVNSLRGLEAGDIHVNVLHSGTGNISSDDVMLASASGAIVIGFNVGSDQGAKRSADAEGVDIRYYDVIYRLTEDIEKALKGMLAPERRKVELGRAEVREVFRIPKIGNIAGSFVQRGEIRRNGQMRVVRDGEVIHEGPIGSLRHLKDDVREVREGFECGIGLRGFDGFKAGDSLECYTEEDVPAE